MIKKSEVYEIKSLLIFIVGLLHVHPIVPKEYIFSNILGGLLILISFCYGVKGIRQLYKEGKDVPPEVLPEVPPTS